MPQRSFEKLHETLAGHGCGGHVTQGAHVPGALAPQMSDESIALLTQPFKQLAA